MKIREWGADCNRGQVNRPRQERLAVQPVSPFPNCPPPRFRHCGNRFRVRSQGLERQRLVMRDPREQQAHGIGHRQPHCGENRRGFGLYGAIDTGLNECVCGHVCRCIQRDGNAKWWVIWCCRITWNVGNYLSVLLMVARCAVSPNRCGSLAHLRYCF
jgi:hypothetical protein